MSGRLLGLPFLSVASRSHIFIFNFDSSSFIFIFQFNRFARAHRPPPPTPRRSPVYTDRVERLVEHHPVGREFVVETRPTGAVRETAGAVESGGTTERAVGAAEPKAACDL